MINIKSIVFLFILILIVSFFSAFNLGKKIQKIDSDYLLKTQKSKIIITTPTPISMKFEKIILEKCNKEIIVPDFFQITKNKASNEAVVRYKNQFTSIICK